MANYNQLEITVVQFKEAIRRHGVFHLADCSICGYRMGWSFQGEVLYYDAGCYCTGGERTLRPTSDEELAFYFEPTHGWIAKLTDFIRS